MHSRVARRYAQALFEVAVEKNQLTSIENDFALLKKDYRDVEDFRTLMISPVISNQDKQKAFTALYQKRLQTLTFDFVSLLIAKNREGLLEQVFEELADLLDEHRGIVRGDVYSVVPFSAAQLARLKKHLDQSTQKNVVLTQHIDASLLGGFVVKIDDLVYDTSLRNQLSSLRETLVQS